MLLPVIALSATACALTGLTVAMFRLRRDRRDIAYLVETVQLLEDANYRLACELCGTAAVDHAVARAGVRKRN